MRIMSTDVSGNPQNYYLYDGLGSVANVTDASGNVDVTYTYEAFGAIRTQSSASANYWGFTGEQRDEETGLTYLRARYYDPETGRFLSTDPLGGGYPYAGNSPLNFIDPSGLALTVVCDNYDAVNNVCYAAHFEGTVEEMQQELEIIEEAGYGETAPAGLLREAIEDSGGAPTDHVASPVYVAVEESTGGTAVVADQPQGCYRNCHSPGTITPPNTGRTPTAISAARPDGTSIAYFDVHGDTAYDVGKVCVDGIGCETCHLELGCSDSPLEGCGLGVAGAIGIAIIGGGISTIGVIGACAIGGSTDYFNVPE